MWRKTHHRKEEKEDAHIGIRLHDGVTNHEKGD